MEKIYDVGKILSRLRFALKLSTWKNVAAFLGEKEGTLSAWKTKNRQSCVTKILYKSRGVATESWLLTGEGPMLETEGNVTIPEMEVAGSATSTPPEPSNISPAFPDRNPPKMVPLISWVQAGGIPTSGRRSAGRQGRPGSPGTSTHT